ncbi:efflux RND transporter periplasmic adaptor subunit [Neorhizobium alkalisoli]|jgi:RND family efflux transporter MFP subunit|uniref:RND family efflux transporter MFP subunit n=1 Tax=Neorhizobium alkalisoli TaxID=528178 RepID=A0A561QGG1_9HYPH|nr:HlyD family secretion protein [Neorhizobium alkalisoli]TWF49458.1 RND family efflux transporter MFP subunit [Neorhizobium alkalisoli]
MKSLFAASGRVLVTCAFVGVAGVLGWHVWDYYMNSPWTRDGKLQADVVRLTTDVSGIVSDVEAHDNQKVKAGDVIFRIDGARFALAKRQAEAELTSSQAALRQAQADLSLYQRLGDGSVTKQKIDQAQTSVDQAEASFETAKVALDTAELNLERSTVKAPVNGIITNFSLQPGDYITAGSAVTALVDSDSYYVDGYFEENKLDRIKPGDQARIGLMGTSEILKGHVVGIAAGIVDRERSETTGALANVNPTFTWVRLAQRVPVRIALDEIPAGTALVAGRTASVSIVDSGEGKP